MLADGTGAPCLWDWLTSEICQKTGGWHPYLVHRLDKGASGIWLVARTQEAQSKLTQQFNKREVDKIYLAGVWGIPPNKEDTIDLPLEKARKGKFRIARKGTGYPSQTHYRLLWSDKRVSLLLIRPMTGRTHQIRVHLQAMGTPVIGDYFYGGQKDKITPAGCFMLHCYKLSLFHPQPAVARPEIFLQGAGGKLGRVGFQAPPPSYFNIFPVDELLKNISN